MAAELPITCVPASSSSGAASSAPRSPTTSPTSGGASDVVLLERDRLTSGTTWHAAGLMTCFGSFSETSTSMRLYSRDLYARLEAETGQATGFKPVGLIEAAADADRLEEYRRVAAFQRHLGLEVDEISPAEMNDAVPLGEDRRPAGRLPRTRRRPGQPRRPDHRARQGRAAARRTGPRGRHRHRRRHRDPRPGRERHRRPAWATQAIECEYVVNATGMWARELALRSGLNVPNTAAEHYYLITDTIEGLGPDTPVFEDPAAHGYYREEGGGMMVGLFEPRAAAWHPEGVPAGSSFTTLKPDWDRMGPFLETAMSRVPVTLEAGVRTFFCGPGVVHARPVADRRRGAGHPRVLRGRRHELRRRAVGRRPRPGRRAVDRGRQARRRRDRASTWTGSARTRPRSRTGPPGPPRSSAPCTPPTRPASSCTPPAAPSSRPCTTGWSPTAATCARSPAGRAPTGSPARA